jgi:hypothetical protein
MSVGKKFIALCSLDDIDNVKAGTSALFRKHINKFSRMIIDVHTGDTILFALNPAVKEMSQLERIKRQYMSEKLPVLSYLLICPSHGDLYSQMISFDRYYTLILQELDIFRIPNFDLWRIVSEYVLIDVRAQKVYYANSIEEFEMN